MPYIPVTCPSGSHKFWYSISTPNAFSTTEIEKDLPTILFIHSGWLAQDVFEAQFRDPRLRQFNLVAVDNLGHGDTEGLIGDQRYTPTENAKDLICVIDALGLTNIHVLGLSLGGLIGLELAVAHPERILSLSICSPLSPFEEKEITSGRMQVFDYWTEACSLAEDSPAKQDLLEDILIGGAQLLFNNEDSRPIKAASVHAMLGALRRWAGTPEKIKQSHSSCILWFIERKELSQSSLAKIQCPVSIIHCSEDFAYPIENAQNLQSKLEEAGVETLLHQVPGPHYALFSHPDEINQILRKTILSVSGAVFDELPLPAPQFDDDRMRTPWTEIYKSYGYNPEVDRSESPADFVMAAYSANADVEDGRSTSEQFGLCAWSYIRATVFLGNPYSHYRPPLLTMKKSLWSFIQDQRMVVPPVATADLSGQTVIVVGANTGLGFEAAKHFARMKPGRLILACRNEEKGKAAVDKLAEETTGFTPELWLLDLAQFSSVSAFADRFEKDGGRLDILVANAAIATDKYHLTSDGWEESLQVNNLATSLLCLLLAPGVVETARKFATTPRIVIVSSDVHHRASIGDDVFDAPSSFRVLSSEEYCATKKNMVNRHHDTKLLNIFFARSLSDLLKGTPVIVNTVNPGYCYSELRRHFAGVRAAFDGVMVKILARTQEEGGRQLVYAAVGGSENPEELKGAYINLHKVEEPSDFILGSVGKKRQDKLWTDLVEELSKIDGRVKGVVSEYS